MPPPERWTREQQLVAFRLYCTERFGKLHQHNPLIVAMAERIGRTTSALAMKACNFASLDPKLARKGLGNASRADVELWQQFEADPEKIAVEASTTWARFEEKAPAAVERAEFDWEKLGPTEAERITRVRLVQGFFRDAVLSSYGGTCAITGLKTPELLVASHIIPWKVEERRRADPRNGLLLNALLDQAFDRGLVTFDEELRLVASRRLRDPEANARTVLEWEGTPLRLPERFEPDPSALAFHREHLFVDSRRAA